MNNLLTNPAYPIILAMLLLGVLLGLLRSLRQLASLRSLTYPYIIGTVTLAGWIAVMGIVQLNGKTLPLTLQHVIVAVLVLSWGAVVFGLIEYMVIERVNRSSGVIVPRLARDIVRATVFILGILFVLQLVFNIAPGSVVISSTVLSAVLGLALQDLLKNVIAGIALQLERPFELGHWIQVDDAIGTVAEMSWRATRIVTNDGSSVIIPNAELAVSHLINYAIPSPTQALHCRIALNHSHPPNLVKQVLVTAMRSSPFVLAEPAPSVKVVEYGDYSITYDLKFWVSSYDRFPDKRDSVMTIAWYALQRADLDLPHPIREVYHHEDSLDLQAQRRTAHLERVQHDLRQAPVLNALSGEELSALAERVEARLFGVGDVLVRQGEPGDTLFVIRSGRVRVDVRKASDQPLTVNRLGPGDCFGEMALMTGAPRNATIIAEDDTEALIVAKSAIAPLLAANPSLPEQLGTLLAEREQMNQAALAHQSATSEALPEPIQRPTLVRRIRQFFGLGGADL